MITFVDGPAAATQTLMLRRAPIYLRVVVSVDGERLRDTEAWRQWCLGQPRARPTREVSGV